MIPINLFISSSALGHKFLFKSINKVLVALTSCFQIAEHLCVPVLFVTERYLPSSDHLFSLIDVLICQGYVAFKCCKFHQYIPGTCFGVPFLASCYMIVLMHVICITIFSISSVTSQQIWFCFLQQRIKLVIKLFKSIMYIIVYFYTVSCNPINYLSYRLMI